MHHSRPDIEGFFTGPVWSVWAGGFDRLFTDNESFFQKGG
jgi:hypothetical protein